jgi:antitoxin FitA
MVADMPVSMTLKNIPDAVYERLKRSAEVHRRSMNSEALVCLEEVLLPTKLSTAERVKRARTLRSALAGRSFSSKDVDALKRDGRP